MVDRGEGYGELVDRALLLAAELHRNQVRKGTSTPYLTHLLGVAALVGEAGGSEVEVAAALLHDAAEDRGGRETLERIRRELGAAVADIVEGCSDTLEDPKPDWAPRKDAYVARLEHEPASVVLVSAADKLHNARAIVSDARAEGAAAVFGRFTHPREDTQRYYDRLVAVYARRGAPARILEPLVAEVEAMRRL